MTFSVVAMALCAACWLFSGPVWGQEAKPFAGKGWAMAVHGGAGSSEWEHMDAATAAAYRLSLGRALQAGVAKLSQGGRALDAVEAAINVLE
ncbi:MAG: isoaspartyl peptidase/L-asparaginase, partial [Acidobacteriaceae bacterium]|nr:isoaspartyl peptidase/L-asparaginase [Acidobacteriaceae bacterium]